MAIGSATRSSRRTILTAGLGALWGLTAGALGRPAPARAADGESALLGQANTSTTETSFQNTQSGAISLLAIQPTGTALRGETTSGTALHVQATGTGFGLTASSDAGTGASIISGTGLAVGAGSNDSTAVWGATNSTLPSTFPSGSYRSGIVGSAGDVTSIATNTHESGVYGFSDISGNSTGGWGDSGQGIGVVGTGDWGVLGVGNVAVRATGTIALQTTGRLVFSGRSGHKYVAAGRSYVDVAIGGMTSGSDVIATLRTRKSGYYVSAVVSYSGKFRLFLNKTATSKIYFNYLVLN